MNKKLIVAHGDLDGITSAALLAEQLGIESEDLNVVFTQPFLVDKIVIPDDTEEVYVVDIAINNRDPVMTEKFIADLGDKLARWYDHHEGWPPYVPKIKGLPDPWGSNNYKNRQFHNDPTMSACAELLGNERDKRVRDAVIADTREGKLSLTGQLIERAVKSDMSNDTIRVWGVKLLMGDEDYRQPLQAAERAYQLVENETYRLSHEFVDLACGGRFVYPPVDEKISSIAFVDATASNHAYDLTQLLLAGQELADFAVAKTINPRTNEEMVTVATKSGLNLVELFDLPSGAPFRVTLPVIRLEEVLKKLEEVV